MGKLNCEFCDKVTLEKQVIFRNDQVLVVYPRRPVIQEHLMVMPVRHVETFAELDDEELLASARIVKKIFNSFKNKKEASGFNLFTNVGRKAGQYVPHFHWHVFIRFDDEKVSPYKILNNTNLRELITPEELEKRCDSVCSIITS